MECEPSPQQKTLTRDEVVRVKGVLENKGLKEEKETKRERKEREEKIEVCLVEEKERGRGGGVDFACVGGRYIRSEWEETI